jgi:hypothetical protein
VRISPRRRAGRGCSTGRSTRVGSEARSPRARTAQGGSGTARFRHLPGRVAIAPISSPRPASLISVWLLPRATRWCTPTRLSSGRAACRTIVETPRTMPGAAGTRAASGARRGHPVVVSERRNSALAPRTCDMVSLPRVALVACRLASRSAGVVSKSGAAPAAMRRRIPATIASFRSIPPCNSLARPGPYPIADPADRIASLSETGRSGLGGAHSRHRRRRPRSGPVASRDRP